MSGVQTTGTEFFLFQERTERQGEKETVFASSSRGETLCPLEDFLDECIKTD